MIEMGDGKFPAGLRREFVQQVKQHHRIQSARHRDENLLATPKQLSRVDGMLDVFPQNLHAAMLTVRWKREQGDSNRRKQPPE